MVGGWVEEAFELYDITQMVLRLELTTEAMEYPINIMKARGEKANEGVYQSSAEAILTKFVILKFSICIRFCSPDSLLYTISCRECRNRRI